MSQNARPTKRTFAEDRAEQTWRESCRTFAEELNRCTEARYLDDQLQGTRAEWRKAKEWMKARELQRFLDRTNQAMKTIGRLGPNLELHLDMTFTCDTPQKWCQRYARNLSRTIAILEHLRSELSARNESHIVGDFI